MNRIFASHTKIQPVLITLLIILILLYAYGGYRYISLSKAHEEAQRSLLSLKDIEEKHTLELQELERMLSEFKQENGNLEDELSTEKNKNKTFEDQIHRISNTVGTLEKLSTTDEELLQKYSKVYFLNEHYLPGNLSVIDPTYLLNTEKNIQIHAKVLPYLTKLLEKASDEDIKLFVASGYRSFDTQANLKSNYTVTYGAGTANQFSADQGYSEHQLGTTVDFTTKEVGPSFEGFEKTDAYIWLTENAYKYGFILSYPPNNSFYEYEPWHWRFVGVDLATDLHKNEKYFYDMQQREINGYLVNVFD